MDQPGEVPEQIEVDWEAGDQVGNAQLGTVEEATLALVGLGVAPATLGQLHTRGFTPGTRADQVPVELWREIVAQMSPQDAANVAQLNQFFHRLVRQGNIPVASAKKPEMVHVYNATQLTAATGMGDDVGIIAVHEGIDGAAVAAAAAAATGKWLLLGPGVTVTGISGGEAHVYAGATVTDITGGTVNVRAGGTATDISGGQVRVYLGGTVTGITGGKVTAYAATVTGVTGGTVNVFGGTATGVTGGDVTVYTGGRVRVPADIELHRDPGNPDVYFNGADRASSTLIIDSRGTELLRG